MLARLGIQLIKLNATVCSNGINVSNKISSELEQDVSDKVRNLEKKSSNSNWKQEKPIEQLIVIIQAAQGELINIYSQLYKVNKQVSKAKKLLEEAQEIISKYKNNL